MHTESTWRMAMKVTLHCLIGCSIGEVLGLIIGTHFQCNSASTVILSIVLAFFFGYLLAILPLRRHLPWSQIIPLVVVAETLSIATMELVDNGVMLLVPSSMNQGLTNPVFWLTMIAALIAGFIITVPVNKMLLDKGKGHALLHKHHNHH